jgi:hypothetical protein
MLPKKYRLTDRKILSGMYRLGIKIRAENGMLMGIKTDKTVDPQISFVIGKKIGKAHIRNKFRRQLSAIFMAYITPKKDEEPKLDANGIPLPKTHYINPNYSPLSGFQMQYVSFKFPNDFEKLKKEFSWQLYKLKDVANRPKSNFRR